MLQLATVTLPSDMQWVDEFAWSPVAQQVEVTCGGALIIEEAAQLAGRPITLAGDTDFAWIDRATLIDLYALASTPRTAPMLLTLEDGRTFNVRFRFSDGAPVEAKPIRHMAPQIGTDPYSLTIRLMQV